MSRESHAESPGHMLLGAEVWASLTRSLQLTDRELQIVQGIFDDEKEKAIADRLGISSHTVHTYLDRLYRKLGVRSRGQLLVRVFAEHLASVGHGRWP